MKFYLSGITAIVMEWLDKGCSDDMDTIIKVITDCVMGDRGIHGLTHKKAIADEHIRQAQELKPL